MIYLAIILGLILGGIFTFAIVVTLVARSNSMGDSKGKFENFSKAPMRMLQRREANNANRLYNGKSSNSRY